MRQLPDHSSFAKEAIACFARRQFRAEKLDGQLPSDHRVKAAHHAAGGADAQGLKELVSPDLHGDLPFLTTIYGRDM
jgi:hypothetical protein